MQGGISGGDLLSKTMKTKPKHKNRFLLIPRIWAHDLVVKPYWAVTMAWSSDAYQWQLFGTN